jgi:hypothetical protein
VATITSAHRRIAAGRPPSTASLLTPSPPRSYRRSMAWSKPTTASAVPVHLLHVRGVHFAGIRGLVVSVDVDGQSGGEMTPPDPPEVAFQPLAIVRIGQCDRRPALSPTEGARRDSSRRSHPSSQLQLVERRGVVEVCET